MNILAEHSQERESIIKKLTVNLPDKADSAALPIAETFLSSPTHEQTSGDGYARTLRYKAWRNHVATALLEAGLAKEANKFKDCSEKPVQWIPSDSKILHPDATTVWLCTGNPDEHNAAVFMPTCDCRICPDCARRQAARLAQRYIPVILDLAKNQGRSRLRHIVLTTPVSLVDDDETTLRRKISRYDRAVSKMWANLEKKGFADQYLTDGILASWEFGTEGLKLHYHIIHYGHYIPQHLISETWSELTGHECKVVFVRAIGQTGATEEQVKHDVIETLKYSTKFWKVDDKGEIEYIKPELMPKLLLVLKGKRRVRSTGVFYNIPEPEPDAFCCPDCGAEMLRVGLENWHYWTEYHAIVDMDALRYKLANKSPPSKGEGIKSKAENVQLKLFDDSKLIPQITHYQREDDF